MDLIKSDPTNILYEFKDLPISNRIQCCLRGDSHAPDKKIRYASVGIVQDLAGKVLITRRSKNLKTFPGGWVFPGGRLDPAEEFIPAMLREVYEETGIMIKTRDNVNFYYKDKKCVIDKILLYESLYPQDSPLPREQTLVIYYSVMIPVYSTRIQLNLQLGEIDAYIWVYLKEIYQILNSDFLTEVYGYIYNQEKKEFEIHTFAPSSFRPHFLNPESYTIDRTKTEYIPHGHRTAIKILYEKFFGK